MATLIQEASNLICLSRPMADRCRQPAGVDPVARFRLGADRPRHTQTAGDGRR